MASIPWMEDTLALVVALALGITSALGVLKVRHKWMWISWFLALCLGAFTLGMLGRYPEWAQRTGTSSILWHHSIYIVNAFLFSALFVLIFANWTNSRSKPLLYLLGTVTILKLGILPGLGYVLDLDHWNKSKTLVDQDGVCRQSTDYSCGPAAVVTALMRLGIQVSESEIALASRANSFGGTQPLNLLLAIHSLNSPEHPLQARILTPGSIENIPTSSPAVALVKHSQFNNHYVCILGSYGDKFLIADPDRGAGLMSRPKFSEIYLGLIIQIVPVSAENLV
jgi:predicted double-glycine peptidase/uncharacterized membrane protein